MKTKVLLVHNIIPTINKHVTGKLNVLIYRNLSSYGHPI